VKKEYEETRMVYINMTNSGSGAQIGCINSKDLILGQVEPEEGFPIDHSSTVCKPDPVKTVSEIIDDVKTQICDSYCKYADGVTKEGCDQRLEKHCANCPLNKL
jgi:hypothetical protein